MMSADGIRRLRASVLVLMAKFHLRTISSAAITAISHYYYHCLILLEP